VARAAALIEEDAGMELTGKVALVTGSSSGIGEATARRFAELGAAVVCNSRSSVAAGQRVAADLGASYVQGDVSDDDDVARLVATVLEQHGRLDVLVNNAGTTEIIAHRDLERATRDVWRRIFETNVFGTWALSVAAMGALREAGGSIVNVSSLAGLRPTGSSIPYCTSKAALNHLTVLLAKAAAPEVRVNAVAPGYVDTPWWGEDRGKMNDLIAAAAPLKRAGLPEDVAELIVSVATSTYVTGQVFVVDGGQSLVS
jgi:ketoreductase RED2